ncbi:hypothetical protein JYK14_15135 [Siccirubricoccus sp. KC 17139]|uniref:Uncharacterized protein n=1 Tax=Siccirubricoccus soli TaxID=2899147 RepID=A0ABT1D6C9_9PROT|nr:hypothetical protein [Siccirubricoccus soli]MCO6417485.1 hypothetical protein [Siccirubricoccus soli]MCP2683620.1 hypothetical protein [Siccirubricoccus soli]
MRGLLALAACALAGTALAQSADAPNRGLRVPEQGETTNRGLRLPDQAEPPARGLRMPEAAPVAAAPAATRASAAAGAPVMTEAAAACLLRHGAKAAGNTEAWRDIRRICSLYPGIQ